MLRPSLVCRAGGLVLVVLGCALLGCGSPSMKEAAPEAPMGKGNAGGLPGAGRAAQKGAVDQAVVNAAPQAPMIIYTATLDVIVKDLDAATPEVDKLVAAHKGFVAKSEVKGDTGTRRTATYTIRVPVAGFNALKDGVLALGTPERNVVDTHDVTEEFVDVEARIKNLKEQEGKLNELLKEKRKEEKLEDVIKVSDRVFLVRGDIERAQGRRNYLQNRVQLSTITVAFREVKDYKPPTAPTFGTKISDTFENSWDALVGFGKALALVAVALVPWTPLWAPVLFGLVWGGRRLLRVVREPIREPAPRARRVRGEAIPDAEATVIEPVHPPEEPKP